MWSPLNELEPSPCVGEGSQCSQQNAMCPGHDGGIWSKLISRKEMDVDVSSLKSICIVVRLGAVTRTKNSAGKFDWEVQLFAGICRIRTLEFRSSAGGIIESTFCTPGPFFH